MAHNQRNNRGGQHDRSPFMRIFCAVVLMLALGFGANNSGAVAQIVPNPVGVDGTIRIDPSKTSSFSKRLNGSNLSFFNGPMGYADQIVRARTKGNVATVRYPGGQDSQRIGWASCQLGSLYGTVSCQGFTDTAKPSDFIGFIRATGAEPIVTLNINVTAKENAAYVAFMNGRVGDQRIIGIDQSGTDWKTVDYWAQLRTSAGYAEPLNVKLWEFGNETYGGIGRNGCVDYGWEFTYTCNATEYLNGLGTGAARFDGYIATRAALREIDPSILLGAPAADPIEEYNGWTRSLLAQGTGSIDFLEVHPYVYFQPPPDTPAGNAQILAYPQRHWAELEKRMSALAVDGKRIPMLFSEYNLTAAPRLDPSKRIQRAINGLALADSVGVLAQNPNVIGANQFDLYGGPQSDGSFYSQITNDGEYVRTPSYWSSVLWSRFGSSLVRSVSSFNAASTLSVHTGKLDEQTISVLAINKSGLAQRSSIAIDGRSVSRVVIDAAVAKSLTEVLMTYNGIDNPNDELTNAPSTQLDAKSAATLPYTFPPYSMTLLRITMGPAIEKSTQTVAPKTPATPKKPKPKQTKSSTPRKTKPPQPRTK
jgi:hypothetical protein